MSENMIGIVFIKRDENGALHCEDGPAVMYTDGSYSYYVNSLKHCETGPALYRPGPPEKRLYWLNGVKLPNITTDEQLAKEIRRRKMVAILEK